MILPLAAGVFPHAAPGGRSVNWAVTGRLGGESGGDFESANLADHVGDDSRKVAANRSQLALLVGAQPDRLASMEPEHGAHHAFATHPVAYSNVDALITQQSGLAIFAMGADCVPLVINARDHQSETIAVAAVHCGWKGFVQGVVPQCVDALRELGAVSFDVVLGPSICGECYQVPPDRRNLVAHLPKESGGASVARAALAAPGGIDVRVGLAEYFRSISVDPILIGACTLEDSRNLFSYRRNPKTGRQGSVIMISEGAR